MNFGRQLLDFEGRRIEGRTPYLVLEGPAHSFENVRRALVEGRKIAPKGGAIGYVAYEAAREWEPRAFSRWHPLDVPTFRLVFYRNLIFREPPQTNGFWRNVTVQLHEVPDIPAVRHDYCEGVAKVQDFIAAGDIYQANLVHHFERSTRYQPRVVYQRLADLPPFGAPPRGAFLEWDDFSIVSNSPETFLTLHDDVLESKPIKGTIRRGNGQDDEALKQQLQHDPKNRAENVMIVDLLRNDLGRVCEFGSVHVPALCEIQTLPTLHHLVSTVRGKIRSDCDAVEAFKAAFPCGSITGAPKIRAMQILSDLEPVARGASMGAIGYFKFDGDMEWSVAIRTATMRDKTATFHVGGGIVADSTPEDEYAEMRLKGRALWSALHG